jgi:hypothetical protein
LAVDGSWIYVANTSNNSIDVFPIGASGNVAPTRAIVGGLTTLNQPESVTVDGSWIYVANYNHNSIDIFPLNATGNVAPTRSIQGGLTTFDQPEGVAVDASWIYVVNHSNDSVDVFPIGATGNVAPTRSIQGGATTLEDPEGIAVNGGNVCPPITLSPATLPAGVLGTSYSQTVSASGGTGPYTFSVSSGALPAGLALNGATGAITGTPTAVGTVNFTITATDTNGCTGLLGYTVTISAVATAIPTVTEWGMILFMVLAGLGSLYHLKRKRG